MLWIGAGSRGSVISGGGLGTDRGSPSGWPDSGKLIRGGLPGYPRVGSLGVMSVTSSLGWANRGGLAMFWLSGAWGEETGTSIGKRGQGTITPGPLASG